ncbi:nibrin [Spea bombifrons]|uniref:nibrin n=1 Tax=Spea bombifrons TaxID=233779 RepID=UPI0023495C43|nr:nibrin [Spea bombifrons]
MWQLVKESGEETFHFLTDTEYVVGRKNCAILIQDDQSISRSHAVFSVSHSASNLGRSDKIPTLTIKDSSKYGTFINEEKMENPVPRSLKSGDRVTFGVFNSKYRVKYEPLVVSSSCLSVAEKTALNQDLLLLGGHMLGNWTENCTHLVMTSIKVTIKTICAMVCCKPIVKPEYFSELTKSIKQKQTLPALTSFIPLIDEPSIKSDSLDLSVNVKRKIIFKGKVFLFLSEKQYKKMAPAITFGGGEVKLLKGELKDSSLLDSPKTCVIDVSMSDSQLSISEPSQTWSNSILDMLQRKDLRAIPEAEIGLAVIYMSTEIYCNPRSRSSPGNESETSRPNIISQSMAVDETVLPGPTLNITAYVVNTEPQDETNTWMDISGIREVKETPRNSRMSSKTCPERNQETGGKDYIKGALYEENTAVAEKTSSQRSPVNESFKTKSSISQKMPSTNKIKNYFQPLSKKREREDDEKEFSFSKSARMEDITSCPEEIRLQPVINNDGPKSQGHQSDLDMEPVSLFDDNLDVSAKQSKDDMVTAQMASQKDEILKKRKDMEEDLVEESDLESGGELDAEVEQNGLRCNDSLKVKRRRLDAENNRNISGDLDKGALQQPPPETIQKVKVECKEEPESPQKGGQIIKEPKEEYDEVHSRLLLTEFRSLVVGRPAKNNHFSNNTNHGNVTNFKKFRKVAYPGAGGFPHIIGGSDLIAHDRKKNSELEQWLRQEVEEQAQQAKEDSLAEDLFRYNPKIVKRRR